MVESAHMSGVLIFHLSPRGTRQELYSSAREVSVESSDDLSLHPQLAAMRIYDAL